MREVRYIGNQGLDMNEEKILKKLSDYAKEGWILDRMGIASFRLVKQEPQEIRYMMDCPNRMKSKEAYLEQFTEAGWLYVCDYGNVFIFSSLKKTTPVVQSRTYKEVLLGKKVAMAVSLLIIGLSTLFLGTEVNVSNTYITSNTYNMNKELMIIFGAIFTIAACIWLLKLSKIKELSKDEILIMNVRADENEDMLD